MTSYHKMFRLYINMKLVFWVHGGHVHARICLRACVIIVIYYYLCLFYKANAVGGDVNGSLCSCHLEQHNMPSSNPI